MGNIEEILESWRTKRILPYPLSAEEILSFWNLACPSSIQVKEAAVRDYGDRYNIHTFIETGTWHGDMVQVMIDYFDKIISIELDDALYLAAADKFSSYSHIDIIYGDSSKELPKILDSITEPCLFWLDGHYIPLSSDTAKGDKDTPILEELDCILNHPIHNHVILIDDARCFIGPNSVLNDYPSIPELRNYVLNLRADLVFEVKDDIVRIHMP